MAFTDSSDLFASFHEDGFNRLISHVMQQRPSLFNYRMNMTTLVDSFDKLKLFSGAANESTSTKRYFPQTEGVRTCR